MIRGRLKRRTIPPVSPLLAFQHHQNQEVMGLWRPSAPLPTLLM